MPHIYLDLDLDEPAEAHALQADLASLLQPHDLILQVAAAHPNDIQPMGESLLEIIHQTGQHIMANQAFYLAWLGGITTLVTALKERKKDVSAVGSETKTAAQLTIDRATNEELLRQLLTSNEAITIQIRDVVR